MNTSSAQIEQALSATLASLPPLPNDAVKENPQERDKEAKEAKEPDLPERSGDAPLSTFEKMPFEQLMQQYDHTSQVAPSLELGQAFLMTSNMRYGAGQVTQHTPGGVGYFFQSDYVGDAMRLSDSLGQICKLVGNLGPADKSTNFILEQRNLLRSQADEDRDIRDAIKDEIVDGLEYVRTKEKIALTKQRVKDILNSSLSDNEDSEPGKDEKMQPAEDKVEQQSPKASPQQDTEEDSQKAYERHKQTSSRIMAVIKQLRKDARAYLGITDSQHKPLSTLYHRLNRSKEYKRRRMQKALRKGTQTKVQLNEELNSINKKLEAKLDTVMKQDNTSSRASSCEDQLKMKEALKKQIQQLKQVLGVEKRVKQNATLFVPQNDGNQEEQALSVTQLDAKPVTAASLQLQDILFDFCGVGRSHWRRRTQQKDRLHEEADKVFGRIKKLPVKSSLFQGFSKESGAATANQQPSQQVAGSQDVVAAKNNNFELVKVIGLEPEKVFKSLDKYVVQVHKMPKFSNVFDSYESFVAGLGGSNLTQNAQPGAPSNPCGQGGATTASYARQDGRAVISLNFNPYDLDSKLKQKIYEGAVKDLIEHRVQQTKQISNTQRDKQEQMALRRAWVNIAKKDIPKAYRVYIKYKADQKQNNKKLSVGCCNEVKKKAVRVQRNAKECVMRAKKLTREMLSFWRRRDKELADMKRKKERFDKEQKKKLQEEEEMLLQKKRLEYLMKQSEIYAHFMANKMGMQKEMKQTWDDVADAENQMNYKRVQVDESNAKKRMAKMIKERKQELREFDGINNSMNDEHINEEELDVNRFDLEEKTKAIEQPRILTATLKHYQLRGLRWLDNLYEQGINGILADEMGLGKTIQAISLMAHIAETKGTWGPFLIVVPVVTLHNWKNELEKYCPSLKVLPYWGSQDERKKLAKFLDPKHLTNPSMQIHVLITSYNLIVNNPKDQARLLKIKWNYMILDEAQAIKNNLSRRWKVLLQFNARNRLLLTGTPIQNSMAELWALLHFIMPKLFDNHEQFQEWFSKDIEASSMDRGELNRHQLKRLHAILKPFMLRRLKRDVEQEIGQKTEIELTCVMTYRQRLLYQRIKNKISARDLVQLAENKDKMENLMNLVMQFRKVCNHPDLFERQIGRNPLVWKDLQIGVQQNQSYVNTPEVRTSAHNPIRLKIPKIIFDECWLQSTNENRTFQKLIPNEDYALSHVSITTHHRFFNIFNAENLHRGFYGDEEKSCFGILRFVAKSNDWSASDMSFLMACDPVIRAITLLHSHRQRHTKQVGKLWSDIETDSTSDITEVNYHSTAVVQGAGFLDLQVIDFMKFDEGSIMYRETKIISVIDNSLDVVQPLIPGDPQDWKYYSGELRSLQLTMDLQKMFVPPAVAESVQIEGYGSGVIQRYYLACKHNPNGKKLLLGQRFKPAKFLNLARCSNSKPRPEELQSVIVQEGLFMNNTDSMNIVDIPKYGRLVTDCAKMRIFAELVIRLQVEKHRCLVFCQMTRMLDILEDFLTWKKMTYLRMDGSTSIQDRRYMVDEFQRNDNIFIFLLSTRAGGLGVNLIAADTVIFYDNDWNPTMDEQATDRAHRIGQTKPVTVYRIMTKGTVEERIVRRAKQKQNVQSTVYGDTFKMKDVVKLVMDDDDPDQHATPSFIKPKRGRGAAALKKKADGGGSPTKKESGRKNTGKLPGAQAMFDAIDREEDASGSDEEDVAVTFNAGDYDELGKGKKGASKVEEQDEQMDEY